LLAGILSAPDISKSDATTVDIGASVMRNDPDAFLPLTPAELHILLALADGERHGYAIMQEVRDLTAGRLRLGPGTLYGTIKRMLGEGLLVETEERPDRSLNDERRRYYRLTDLGRDVLAAEVRHLEAVVDLARAKRILPRSGASPA
jgi:DNA-binding PadR family transcriptional regulator